MNPNKQSEFGEVPQIEPCGEGSMTRRRFLTGAGIGVAGIAASAVASRSTLQAFAGEDGGLAQDAGAGESTDSASSVDAYEVPSVADAKERSADAKRVLVVIDYQVDFVSGGVFGDIEPAIAIEDALYDCIKQYQDAGDIVIYTMDTHPQDTYDLTREGQFNPPHCIPGTSGWEVYGRVAELLSPDRAIELKKPTYGCKILPSVIQAIKDQGVAIELIEIAGVSTTCRVLHNAILLYNFFPEAMLVMDVRTTASYTDEATREQLEELEGWGFTVKW